MMEFLKRKIKNHTLLLFERLIEQEKSFLLIRETDVDKKLHRSTLLSNLNFFGPITVLDLCI